MNIRLVYFTFLILAACSCEIDEQIRRQYANATDLGLSVKWSSCNIGADKPEESGRYFSWGDKVGQTWNGSCWSGDGFSSYPVHSLDDEKVLSLRSDAAHVFLGGSWRMPTKEEFQELVDNCTSKWTAKDGVYGMEFTSKKNGKSIFLPARGKGIRKDLNQLDTCCFYWSKTFDHDYCSWGLQACQEKCEITSQDRCCGFPIRPVTE